MKFDSGRKFDEWNMHIVTYKQQRCKAISLNMILFSYTRHYSPFPTCLNCISLCLRCWIHSSRSGGKLCKYTVEPLSVGPVIISSIQWSPFMGPVIISSILWNPCQWDLSLYPVYSGAPVIISSIQWNPPVSGTCHFIQYTVEPPCQWDLSLYPVYSGTPSVGPVILSSMQ